MVKCASVGVSAECSFGVEVAFVVELDVVDANG